MPRARFDEGLLLSAALREHMNNRGHGEGGPGDWWFAARRENGEPIEFSSMSFGTPYMAKRVFAHDMCGALNKHLDHDGTWIVAWTHPMYDLTSLSDGMNYGRFHFVWLDRDGDPQFGIICECSAPVGPESFIECLREPPEKWLQDAEDGYRMYCEQKRILDLTPHQQFMAARGERVPSPTRH